MPYTYLIGWSEHNKFYYGVRFAKNCNPEDLWTSYFTSSKHVKNFRQMHGEPNIIQVRKVFDNAEDAKLWEEKVLRKMKVITDTRFLNKNVNGKFLKSGNHSSEHVAKRIAATTLTRKMNGSFIISDETKKKISMKSKGKPKPFSDKHADSVRKHIKIINDLTAECPHCNKTGQYANMKRWHFNKCKLSP